MADIDRRLRYFNGQFLQEPDFTAEQAYHLDRQRRHNRLMHTYGIAEGLTVTASQGATQVTVAPGTAIDSLGQQIVLVASDSRTLSLAQPQLLGKTVLVVISYAEAPADPATSGGGGSTRFQERPDVRVVVDDGTPPPAVVTAVRLARLTVGANGATTANPDLSVRVTAGVKVGSDVTTQTLHLSRPDLLPATWPVLSAGAAGRLDLLGNLSLTSGSVNGTVNGRDVARDGTALDGHIADLSNPHKTTAAQVGAPTSVGGVSNAGGAISMAGSGGVSVIGDNSAKKITIAGTAPSTIANVSNPGADIGIVGSGGVGVSADNVAKKITIAGATIAGISNPGSDIGIVSGGGITVNADNAAKKITLSTSVQALGALAASDYDIGLRAIGTLLFTQDNADGMQQVLPLTFKPRIVFLSGVATASFSNVVYGGPVNGFAELESQFYAHFGAGPLITKTSSGIVVSGAALSGAATRATFKDNSVGSHGPDVDMQIYLGANPNGGLNVVFKKLSYSGTFLNNFSISLAFYCMGL